MTGNLPDLVEYARLAREHDAILYVDDAHGFGVIGERHPDELSPYGTKGNAIVRYLGENYDNVVLIGALSKAYSSLMAFLAIPTELKTLLKSTAPPYVYSGPSPVASLATVLEGLRVNRERGDQIRQVLHDRTKRIGHDRRALTRCGQRVRAADHPGPAGHPDRVSEAGDMLFERGLDVTMCPYPIVPRREAGFRLQITAANGEEHVDRLVSALHELQDLFRRREDAQGPARPKRFARTTPRSIGRVAGEASWQCGAGIALPEPVERRLELAALVVGQDGLERALRRGRGREHHLHQGLSARRSSPPVGRGCRPGRGGARDTPVARDREARG